VIQIRILALALFVFAVSVVTASAQEVATTQTVAQSSVQENVPRLVQFGATLKDSAGRPIGGVASVTFAVYAEQDGGSPLWIETQNVLADLSGHYSALLGTSTAGGFPAEIFGTGESRWLGVTIARQSEMPRVLLASVPYALKAGDAQTLGGLPASSYVTTQQLASHTAAPNTTVIADAGTEPPAPAAAGASLALSASTDQVAQSVTQAAITGAGTANYVPIWTSGSNLGVSKIYEAKSGFVGINTDTPLLQLDVNGNSIFRGSFQMAPQGTATASSGQPSHSFQWQGSVFNSSTHAADNLAFGFRTVPDQNDVASPTAKLDLFYGPGGGTLNDLGLSISNTGVITFVPGQIFTGSLNLPSTAAILLNGSPFISGGTSNNAAFGADAFPNEAGSNDNVAVGQFAMVNATNAIENVAVGAGALPNVAGGGGNVAAGFEALEADTTAGEEVAVGDQALYNTTIGNSNVAIGSRAGYSNTTGGENAFLGSYTDAGSPGLTNATAIGALAYVTNSGTIVLGSIAGVNNATQSVHVGIGTTTPAYALHVVDTDSGPMGHSAIYGTTPTPDHNGIIGSATANNGSSNGGYFTSASPSGAGIYAANSAGGLAASLQGDVQITGKLTKGGGSFKIDDPIDPAGKYLSHSFVESPDMMNIYNGNVTTNAKGYATITLPPYFEALNRDFRYQLTAVGVFAEAIVATEIKDNEFTIRTSKPHVKVSWQVTGVRHDAWADANRIPNEEKKPASEQGKYLHPELFGAGPEKSVNAARGNRDVPALKSSPRPVVEMTR
jgi:trimeric autotransporter adhesin